jgi:hypothetical protein
MSSFNPWRTNRKCSICFIITSIIFLMGILMLVLINPLVNKILANVCYLVCFIFVNLKYISIENGDY